MGNIRLVRIGLGPPAVMAGLRSSRCGAYGTTSDFTPWSTPYVADAVSTDSFPVQAGVGGGPCPGTLPFEPQLIAGSTTD